MGFCQYQRRLFIQEAKFRVMQTTDKALSLLSQFSESRPQIGLSEFARLARFDKATTRRLLISLIRNGLVEQHPETRKYRLGASILSLARKNGFAVTEGGFELEVTGIAAAVFDWTRLSCGAVALWRLPHLHLG
ncbi:MAG: DNA-binding IclR family transcriptional regulator [Parasphingorhabdus sp.]